MMYIRSFEWRDLPVLHRYRRCGLFLDTALLLTRGPLLVTTGSLFSTAGLNTSVYTCLCNEADTDGRQLLAQVTHAAGSTYARLSYLAPDDAVALADLPALFDHLAPSVGERGAFHILAEVDEHSQALDALRQAGFAIYANQRIWKLEENPAGKTSASGWKKCREQDTLRIRSLYNDLVPGLVQQVEPLSRQPLKGMVYYQDGNLLAYVDLRYGKAGIWAQPFIHPDVRDFAAPLGDLLHSLPVRTSRPVYICVRSYQSWLEGMVEAVGAEPGVSQAVMVRHLSVARRAAQPAALPAMNGTRIEPITHIVLNPDEQVKNLPGK
jgi:hypothetical protein